MTALGILSVAFSLFLLMDPIGNIPLYISTLKEIHPKRQQWIIFRELIIALIIIIIFNYIGNGLLNFLNITRDSVQIAGGVILFIISMRMIFPSDKPKSKEKLKEQEPFIVPLAVPLVAGPTVLAAVMIYSHQYSSGSMLISISVAWAATLIILLLAPYISRLLGSRGIIACERLMGLILTMISVQMLLSGIHQFIQSNQFH